MSSVLEFGTEDALFAELNNEGTGFIIELEDDSNFVIIGEDPIAAAGDDIVTGGSADDMIFTNDGDDIISGGDGDDTLFGEAGNDIISGGNGDDIIDGGTGRDILFGGEGLDIFRFDLEDFQDGEVDTIQDFEQGIDEFLLGSDIDTDLISIEGNLIKYDGQDVIEVKGDEPDLEIF